MFLVEIQVKVIPSAHGENSSVGAALVLLSIRVKN